MKFAKTIEEADAIIIGFPVDQGTENKGTKDAPAEVRKAFDNFYFSENAKESKIYDVSDVVEEEDFEKTMEKIEKKISELLKHKKPIISIGGNHSVTAPIVKAFSKKHKNFGIIFLDAHPDCQKDYFPFGDVVSKIVEMQIPIVIIGVRNWSEDEYNFLIENKIPFLQAKDFTIEKAIELAKKHLPNKVYISFDIDFIDAAFAPGTGCIEPGGISSRDSLNLLHNIGKNFTIIGSDMVEVNPSKDTNNLTTNLAAKIILEVASISKQF
ncbi:MAG: agmatinase [Nanoarchaeota archaeon]|nr:agmatinase [Nanoarchaeota archaeon]